MNATVSTRQAKKVLHQAISEIRSGIWQPASEYSSKIREVILGSHLTYRYILITGLLAKATNEKANPLALQAGSLLNGAYDARSLCHKVVVPLERELLGSRLGGSNEPFLNKPARYTELSTSNAVRRGRDTQTLRRNIMILSGIKTTETAYIALKDAIYFVFQRPSRDISEYLIGQADHAAASSLIAFAQQFVSISHEGETSVLLVGATFKILAVQTGRDFDVRVHKVNQAGSSSNEIADIDVYDEAGEILYTAEVKDKVFTSEDVEHAITKMVSYKHYSMLFLKGKQASLISATEQDLMANWSRKGVSLYFIDVVDFFTSIVAISPTIKPAQFVHFLNEHAEAARVKDATIQHLVKCVTEQSW